MPTKLLPGPRFRELTDILSSGSPISRVRVTSERPMLGSLAVSAAGEPSRAYARVDARSATLVIHSRDGMVSLGEDASFMFADLASLVDVDGRHILMDEVRSAHAMFAGCCSLPALSMPSAGARKVRDASFMFSGCHSLRSAEVAGLDRSPLSRIDHMFQDCTLLGTPPLHALDLSRVTDASYALDGCRSLESLDLSGQALAPGASVDGLARGCACRRAWGA